MHNDEGIPEELEVLLDSSAPVEDVDTVRGAFNDAGLKVTVRPSFERKSITEGLPWVVLITIPITAFLSAFAAAAGRDAYKGLKKLVRTIWTKRAKTSGSSGSFTIIDSKSRVWLQLHPDIPSDAYIALAKFDGFTARTGRS